MSTIERLAHKIMPEIRKDFRSIFPEAETKFFVDGEGRGVIKVIENGYLVGMEFIETEVSWASKKRMWEYYVVLVNKCRLVVYVPKAHADSARMRLLEFNNYWLNYYLVYSYDEGLRTELVGRPRPLMTSPLRTAAFPLGGYL
ncbi:MAG: hypothetical protein HPY73_01985 [Methanomassiliicoccales archaeon]|nr:MAG: hypothetical protein HPY73_01985 [Methanomassiliicoccales archaeon]